MCFTPGGELYRDFDAIFDPVLAGNIPLKRDILGALVEGPKSGAELAKELDRGRNGEFAKVLKELAQGGFISDDPGKNPETGEDMRVAKYRLRDR